jgi:hypothetical protein
MRVMRRRNLLQGPDLYEYDLTNPEEAEEVKRKLLFYIAEVSNLSNKLGCPTLFLHCIHDLLVERIDEDLQRNSEEKS